MKENCWEFMICGREPNGSTVAKLGVCCATTNTMSNGLNSGNNGGRICWSIAGTYCHDKVTASFGVDLLSCSHCAFFKKVQAEEADKFVLLNYK